MPPLRVVAAYVAVVLVWGTTWAAIKIGVDEVPPFIFAFARALAVASLLTLAAIAFRLPDRSRNRRGEVSSGALHEPAVDPQACARVAVQ